MRGVIYARYSEGPRQTDQSIEGQVSDCTAFAKRSGIDIIEIYADKHISGKSVDKRLEFQRMIQDAKAHKFDVVIVWKIDRFGRDRTDIAINKAVLKRAGVKLLYAQESVPEGPEGIILEAVLEGMAEYYSADLRQKVLRGRRETLKKGRHCGQVLPIGYKTDEDRHIVLDPEKAPAVREMFRMYAAGAGMNVCVSYLNDLGILSNRGGKITPGVIYRMLRNKKYLGIFDSSGVELRVEPLIDEATFRECAEHFPSKHRNAAGRADVNYLLSCRCFCGYCATMLVGESGKSKTGKVYNYYKCGKQKRGSACKLKPIRKEALEDLVIHATVEDMLTEETIGMLTDEILKIQEEELKNDPAGRIQKQLDNCRRKIQNLITAIEETGTPGLATRLAALEDDEHELVLQLEKAKIQQPRLTREDIDAWLRSFCRGTSTDQAFRQRLLETFVARVELRNDILIIYYNISDKKKQKRGISLCSDKPRLLEHLRSYSNTPVLYRGYIILLVDRAA